MMTDIPKDPVLLLSWLNTQLRDSYPSLEELCASLQLDQSEITKKLNGIGCFYQKDSRQFK